MKTLVIALVGFVALTACQKKEPTTPKKENAEVSENNTGAPPSKTPTSDGNTTSPRKAEKKSVDIKSMPLDELKKKVDGMLDNDETVKAIPYMLELCDRGQGNMCYYVAETIKEKEPERAKKLLAKGCSKGGEAACKAQAQSKAKP